LIQNLKIVKEKKAFFIFMKIEIMEDYFFCDFFFDNKTTKKCVSF